jgi:hypothetical protein
MYLCTFVGPPVMPFWERTGRCDASPKPKTAFFVSSFLRFCIAVHILRTFAVPYNSVTNHAGRHFDFATP